MAYIICSNVETLGISKEKLDMMLDDIFDEICDSEEDIEANADFYFWNGGPGYKYFPVLQTGNKSSQDRSIIDKLVSIINKYRNGQAE